MTMFLFFRCITFHQSGFCLYIRFWNLLSNVCTWLLFFVYICTLCCHCVSTFYIISYFEFISFRFFRIIMLLYMILFAGKDGGTIGPEGIFGSTTTTEYKSGDIREEPAFAGMVIIWSQYVLRIKRNISVSREYSVWWIICGISSCGETKMN